MASSFPLGKAKPPNCSLCYYCACLSIECFFRIKTFILFCTLLFVLRGSMFHGVFGGRYALLDFVNFVIPVVV